MFCIVKSAKNAKTANLPMFKEHLQLITKRMREEKSVINSSIDNERVNNNRKRKKRDGLNNTNDNRNS
jgi:hypothetical protein